jgi:hypothetical protein
LTVLLSRVAPDQVVGVEVCGQVVTAAPTGEIGASASAVATTVATARVKGLARMGLLLSVRG